MINGKSKRKEVSLSEATIKNLTKLAEKDKRPLKNYMEIVLNTHAKIHTQLNKPGSGS
jgi:hypothetical protein